MHVCFFILSDVVFTLGEGGCVCLKNDIEYSFKHELVSPNTLLRNTRTPKSIYKSHFVLLQMIKFNTLEINVKILPQIVAFIIYLL